MTLIATTKNFGHPFLVGDILLTSEDEKISINLPTNTIDINKYMEFPNGAPVGFCQKIYIIKKNVCVALAGRLNEMTLFLEELISFCSYFNENEICLENPVILTT